MATTYDAGWVFICEGSTEKTFYICLLEFLCQKYGVTIQKVALNDGLDIVHEIHFPSKVCIIKIYDAGALTNMPKAGKWFEEECVKRYLMKRSLWSVFLCYDTDGYQQDITPYYEGDWKTLREKIGKAEQIVDLAAAADMEDVLLADLDGICEYLGIAHQSASSLSGRKGSSKMKALFRSHGQAYHKGERAETLIKALDMQKIIDTAVIPLKVIDELFRTNSISGNNEI